MLFSCPGSNEITGNIEIFGSSLYVTVMQDNFVNVYDLTTGNFTHSFGKCMCGSNFKLVIVSEFNLGGFTIIGGNVWITNYIQSVEAFVQEFSDGMTK